MAARAPFAEEEMAVDEGLGYPKAYAKLCRNAAQFSPFSEGPPLAFSPYALPTQELIRSKDLNQMFPVINPEAKPSVNPNNYVNLLWKQLSHLGNAGFDPALFRVDPYGNVIYFYADHGSPLSWAIDHWFPCSRGGKTVPSNLRLLQWLVCRKKHNKLEFLVPWWDLQLGISINQFLCIFASKNSDFRNRAFSFLFAEGGNEELNELQVVESLTFPQHFIEKKRKLGLAPAAIVSSSLVMKPLSLKSRPSFSQDDNLGGTLQKSRPSISKENENPNVEHNNPYQTIALARNSLRQREEAKKMQVEMGSLEEELKTLMHNNESERFALQDLERELIQKRRRIEKCRRLAEAQSSYKALLEKMIRDAMHQSVVYKEQLRLNQAATSALMARLEAQRALCDSSEKELHRKHRQRDEIEKQIRPCSESARKRSRTDDTEFDNQHDEATQSLAIASCNLRPSKKELRLFLEEEQKAYEAALCLGDEQREYDAGKEPEKITDMEKTMDYMYSTNEISKDLKLKKLKLVKGSCSKASRPEILSVPSSPVVEYDDKQRTQMGKDNIEKWLQILFDNTKEGSGSSSPDLSPPRRVESEKHTMEVVHKLNFINPQKEIKFLQLKHSNEKEGSTINCHEEMQQRTQEGSGEALATSMFEKGNYQRDVRTSSAGEDCRGAKNFEGNEQEGMKEIVRSESTRNLRSFPSSPSVILGTKNFEGNEQEGKKEILRSESTRNLRSFPSSPSVILGMRRGFECIAKKPLVMGEYDDDCNSRAGQSNSTLSSKIFKSRSSSMKKRNH